ncbi:MAG: PhnD/SsuA/transferrin family substrate-binding protein [Cyanobacteria bacterium J06626_4]
MTRLTSLISAMGLVAATMLFPSAATVMAAPDPLPSIQMTLETPPIKRRVRIGVIAARGINHTETKWQPTIEYLNQAIPSVHFELIVIDLETVEAIVQTRQIDFLLANPGTYVKSEMRYGARRIATLENFRAGRTYSALGAVIFRRADRTDIQTLHDLKGQQFMAASETAFDGWQIAWATLQKVGIDPYQQFQSLAFSQSHDDVVYAVLNGEVDAGTVRTDTLERMTQAGKINLRDIVVLNHQTQPGDSFPFVLSSELYPEWPMAALAQTPTELSEQVATALMMISADHPAAQAGQYGGWTIPANYSLVHETLRELQVSPYEDWGQVSLSQVLYQYRYWLAFTATAFATLGYVGMQLINRRRIEDNLRRVNATLEERVEARTQELRAAKEKAETANRSKSKFLSNMSHELRTPLNAILGFTEVMLRDLNLSTNNPETPRQSQQETLSIIYRSSDHLLSLINNVLDMSKIEAGHTTLRLNPFDLKAMLAALIEMLHLRATTQGILLQYECGPQVPAWVCGDERKLRQVLINLINNAIKFTQEGAVVLRVGAIAPPPAANTATVTHTVTFEVKDTGVGIAAADIKHLFDPFVQAQAGQRSQEGTGLGLPISRQFVELMGGELQVKSTLGIGTSFQFSLPVTAAAPPTLAPPRVSRHVIGLAPDQPEYRILVVDDQLENRQLLRRFLQPLGFQIYAAENGREAVEQWQRHRPQLIWMDIRMPVMNGYEATQAIKRQSAGQAPVIIALTASVFENERSHILQAGCDDFVRKPISVTELFDKLTQHLGVRYLYQNESLSAAAQQGQSPLTTSELADQLAAQPQAWVTQLQLAARGADEDLIWPLLEQLSPTQSALAQALTELVNDFHLDQIVHLTQAVSTTDGGPSGTGRSSGAIATWPLNHERSTS